ncbi:MAG: (d)CMP kinase, partial [Christensenellaceae bacterium]|nr:(d)CMP kinase [Christensenellaceae bacterium]
MIKIAIDGPAGAGKSTVAKHIAQKMQINYMDTGAMYRAVAYAMLQKGIDVKDPKAVEAAIDEVQIDVVYKDGVQIVLANGEDVMPYIRTPEVSSGASSVAVVPAVRLKLVATQRETAEKYPIVM